MPIHKGMKFGKHENVTLITFGYGDVGMTIGRHPNTEISDMLLLHEIQARPIGDVKTFEPGTTSDASVFDDVPVVLAFDNAESVGALIHALTSIMQNIINHNQLQTPTAP